MMKINLISFWILKILRHNTWENRVKKSEPFRKFSSVFKSKCFGKIPSEFNWFPKVVKFYLYKLTLKLKWNSFSIFKYLEIIWIYKWIVCVDKKMWKKCNQMKDIWQWLKFCKFNWDNWQRLHFFVFLLTFTFASK